MAESIFIRKAIVGVAEEPTTAPYVFKEPTASEAFYAFDIEITPEQETETRREMLPHYGKLDDIPAGAKIDINFKFMLAGSGEVGVAPHWGSAMKMMGHAEGVFLNRVEYKPTSLCDGAAGNPTQSYSVVVWEDGILYALRGGRADGSLLLEGGKGGVITCRAKGSYVDVTDAELPEPDSVDDTIPPQFVGAGVTLFDNDDTFSPVFEKYELAFGRQLAEIRDANDANGGIKGVRIADAEPIVSIDPEMVLVATNDFFGAWRAGATGAISTGLLGTTDGNKVQCEVPRAQYRRLRPAERNGVRTLEIEAPAKVPIDGAEGSEYMLTLK